MKMICIKYKKKIITLQKKFTMQINVLEFDNKKIRYSLGGEGDCVVLLHGFIENIEIWDYYFSYLITHYKVLCIEIPGHGKSDLISEVQTMDILSERIEDLLQYLNINKFTLIGHSMGGYIAMAYASKYGDKLNGIGLFHSNTTSDSEENKLGRERAIEIIKLDKTNYLFNFVSNLFAENNKEKFSNKIKWLQQSANLMSKESLISCLLGMKFRESSLHLLTEMNIPFMFIIGKQDSRMPYNMIVAQAMLSKNSHILLLDDCGHMGYIEKEKETLLFVENFIKIVNIK